MSARRIEAALLADSTVHLRRGTEVPEEVWLQMRAEWGSSGRSVARELVVPLERFLARRAAFSAIIKRGGVTVSLDEDLKALVVQANSDQVALRQALANLQLIDAAGLEARLHGGRFTRSLRTFHSGVHEY
jgi:hypothetical protein